MNAGHDHQAIDDVALPRACMRNRIRDVLVARILDGRYPPEFHLKELSLAREFNVSQAPVREALRELEALHLVVSEPYRGTRVRAVDVQELREAYELRSLIEQRSLERAPPLSPQQLASLDTHLAVMRAATEQKDRQSYVAAVLRLNRQLVEYGGNRTFLATWDSLHWDVRARIALRQIESVDPGNAVLMPYHERVVECLRQGDRVGAVEALQTVYRVFGEWLVASGGS